MKKSRLLSVLLALALVFCMTATAFAAAPALIVTGTGLVPGASETDLTETIINEKAYSMDELKALGAESYLYSAINSKSTQSIFRVEGLTFAKLLADCGYTAGGTITVIAEDGYSKEINLDEERFYFPTFAADNKTAVSAMIAWGSGKGTADAIPTEVTENEKGLTSYIGQTAPDAINQSSFISGIVKIVVGEELPAVITIGDKKLTRAEVMAIGHDEASYTFNSSSGEETDTVIGVYLADLLGDTVADDAILSFTCADGYDVTDYNISYADAKAAKYMLAYEKQKNKKGWEGIYNNKGSGVGYFVLYGEGIKPCKMIDSVTYTAAETTTPVEPTTPAAPADGKTIILTLDSKEATINGTATTMDVVPEVVTINGAGVTFVPVRFVTEQLGLTNNWSAAAPNDVNLVGAGVTGKIVIDSTAAIINGVEKTLLAAPYVSNNRTMVPLRFISENLGYKVVYDAATKTITIK